MQKICCIGTHDSGKSTLCYQQAVYYKTNGKNVKLINEIDSSNPFAIKFNAHSAMWEVHAHIKKELEAMAKNAEIIICDRSPIDAIMYAKVNGPVVGHIMKNLCKIAEDWMDTYDQIYYVRPSENELFPEGIQSTDESFKKKVENCFDDWMENCNLSILHKISILTTSKIFSEKNSWLKDKVA